MEEPTSRSNVVLFNTSKKEKYAPNNGLKKLSRRLRSSYTLQINKEELSLSRLQEATLVIFASPMENFTKMEIDNIQSYIKSGGNVLFMADGNGIGCSNVNDILMEFGIEIQQDTVLRTVYHKYFHPKQVFISNGILNREIANVAKSMEKSNSKEKETEEASLYGNNAEEEEGSHTGLDFVYPYGSTLEVKKPAVPILSTGHISFPMNRPVAAVWQDGGVSAPPQGSGRLAVLGSVDIFSDEWLDKEENMKLQDILIKWLVGDSGIVLHARDAADPVLSEYTHLPDMEALSEKLRSCLEESEELPQDFSLLFDTELFKYDTKGIPEVMASYKQLDMKAETLTLIPPAFENPLPKLLPAVFPPTLREPPPPALDQFDLDEHFADEHIRLAQLTNKCTKEDLDYFVTESGAIMGLNSLLPEDEREGKHILHHILSKIVAYKKLNQEAGYTITRQASFHKADAKSSYVEENELKFYDEKQQVSDYK